MQPPEKPADELVRLQSLRNLLILDTPPEERFDMVTAYAALQFQVPIALVTLVDSKRQWFKSRCGLGTTETSRDISFCGHAILSDDVFIIPDTHKDPRFADNPLVTQEPFIRFYAGAPLVVQDGAKIGTFCLIDRRTRHLEDHEIGHLQTLARIVALEIQGIDAARAYLASVKD